jgi:hypothetical protein
VPEDKPLWQKTYDYDKYGCPMKVFHGTSGFLPTLQLWDGDDYISDVNVDYCMYEANYRIDWTYNATVADVRCLSAPQTWAQARMRSTNRDLSWGPQYYKACWNSTGQQAGYDPEDRYEILNSTGTNTIIFTETGGEGIFLFHVIVLDPDYSYCYLDANFGLYVYGAPLPLWITFLIVLVVTLLMILSLVLLYFWYRFRKLHTD